MKRFIIILGIALAGCNGSNINSSSMLPTTPTQAYVEPNERASNPGSLFNDATSDGLFADNRARRVGDIVLIKIVENSKSKTKADLTSSKTSDSEFGVSAAFGRSSFGALGGFGGGLPVGVGMDPALKTSRASSDKVTGETKRENFVTATIGARVQQVLPGGLLQVQAAREVRVNEETQYMVVTGVLRASDIDSDNSIESTQLADAKIEYFGKGILSDKQRSGWLTRLLDVVWPF